MPDSLLFVVLYIKIAMIADTVQILKKKSFGIKLNIAKHKIYSNLLVSYSLMISNIKL